MAGLKEIRRRITSIRNTKQITRAMKLVSAAKLRRAQEAAVNGRSFAERLSLTMANLIHDSTDEMSHPLMERSYPLERRRIIVIAGERGLCGGYNANVTKLVASEIQSSPVPSDVLTLGHRAAASAKRLNWSVVGSYQHLPEDANKWPLVEITQKLIEDYLNQVTDEVSIVYTKFISAVSQQVICERLLPLKGSGDAGTDEALASARFKTAGGAQRQLLYSPDPEQLLESLIPLLIRSRLRQAALEAKASEHAARMTAMEAATNNADELIESLKLYYNRARQSAITTELIDIIGGSEAID